MKAREYVSGTFCKNIKCEVHGELEGLEGTEYFNKKISLCGDCYAWRLFKWLEEKQYHILKKEPHISAKIERVPQISTKEMAARIKGVDPASVDYLTEDEILTL